MHLPRLIDSCLLFPTSSSCYHHHYHGKHFFFKHSQTSKPSIEHFQIQPRITKGLGNTKQWQTIECKQRGFITVCYTCPYHIFDTAVFFTRSVHGCATDAIIWQGIVARWLMNTRLEFFMKMSQLIWSEWVVDPAKPFGSARTAGKWQIGAVRCDVFTFALRLPSSFHGPEFITQLD